MKDLSFVKGFSRVKLLESGKVIGDSGLRGPNQITNSGFENFLTKLLGAQGGSSQVGYLALGSGGAPASNAVILAGEIMGSTKRQAVTASAVGSKTQRFTATFASSASFITASSNISNVGLFAVTATNATLFAGNTYASSQLNTNQDVHCTYEIQFS
jgi:hypothetical protein